MGANTAGRSGQASVAAAPSVLPLQDPAWPISLPAQAKGTGHSQQHLVGTLLGVGTPLVARTIAAAEDAPGEGADKGPAEPRISRERAIDLLVPRLNPPGFVGLEWLRPRVSAPPSKIRMIQENAKVIRDICPTLPWPQERRPAPDVFLEALLQGFTLPALFGAIRLAYPRRSGPLDLFGNFITKCHEKVMTISRGLGLKPPKSFALAVRLLVKHGEADRARDLVLVWGSYTDHTEDAIVAAEDVEELAEVHEYLVSIRAFWERLQELSQRSSEELAAEAAEFLRQQPFGEGALTNADGPETHSDEGLEDVPPPSASEPAVDALLVDRFTPDVRSIAIPEQVEADALPQARPVAGDGPVSLLPPQAEVGNGGAAHQPEADAAHKKAAKSRQAASAADSDWTDGMRAAAVAWHRAMGALAEVIGGVEPSPEPLAEAERLLSVARAALADFEEARPQLVDAASWVDRARAVLGGVTGLVAGLAVEDPLGSMPFLIPEAASTELDGLVHEAERSLAGAVAARSEEEDIWTSRDGGRVHQIPALQKRIQDRCTEAASGAGRALSLVAAALTEPGGTAALAHQDGPPPANGGQARSGPELHPQAVPVADLGKAPAEGLVKAPASVAQEPAQPGGRLIEAAQLDTEDAEPEDERAALVALEAADEAEDAAEPTVFEAEQADEDPELLRVIDKVRQLRDSGEFSLAWHLTRAASRAMPWARMPYRPAELALAAMRGHVNHAAAKGSGYLDEVLADALEAVRDAAEEGGPEGASRCLSLFLSSVEIALFQPNEMTLQVMTTALRGVDAEVSTAMASLSEAVTRARGLDFSLSPSLMLGATDPKALDAVRQLARAAISEKVTHLEALRFSFTAGNEVRNALCRADGELGLLRLAAADKGERLPRVAADFWESFARRSDAVALVMKTARTVAPRDPLDGPSRDRLVGHLVDLVALCGDYCGANEAHALLGNAKRHAALRQHATSLRTAAEGAAEALRAQDPRRFATDAAEAIVEAVHGRSARPGPLEHLAALHGPMLALASLDFGRGWLPEPYQADEIVTRLMEAELPVLPPPGPERDRHFSDAISTRIERGSFVGARLALDISQALGIGEETRDHLALKWDAELPGWRDWIADEVVRVRLEVERLQRLGEGATPEECQGLLAQIDTIAKAHLPAEIDVEARTEREEAEERVLDFSSARLVLSDIVARTRGLLAEPAREIERRLVALEQGSLIEVEDAVSVRALLNEGDLVAARERVAVVADGGRMPRTQVSANRRFAAFFPAVPDWMATESARDIADAISQGRDVGPLPFSRIAPEGRADARSIYEAWRRLPRQLSAGDAQDRAVPAVLDILTRFGFQIAVKGFDAALTRKQKHIIVANISLDFPRDDRESLLLPDYGSATDGNYRLVIAPTMPNEAQVTALCDTAGVTATLVLVTANVDAARREELALGSCSIQGGRKVLVIDEGLLVYALSETALRPLTLIECAQPFGWARPYADYGRYARVPPEMFFGRNTEYESLVAPSGSCVAFGGRRLGKTALLKHIEARENKPGQGVVVAYTQIEALGRSERAVKIWHRASERLAASSQGGQPPVFASPVGTPEEFDRRVRAWLQQDGRRRILLLLDESDEFVKEDARQGFEQFRGLLRLMDETNRRFKFVMAGLHNVTRLVHAENSPLRQISSDPQRIGQLMGDDLPEAENLIVRPLASMGFAFERREDVWSILSATNYYPVLAQTLCASLLDEIRDEARDSGKMSWTIRPAAVRRIIGSDKVLPSIKEKFNLTIKELDPRYELITYVIAARTLLDQDEGRIEEGLTLAEVRDGAVEHWPAAMANHPNRLALAESLLDEMVGLGVVRKTKSARWALRSPSILALLGSSDSVRDMLAEFRDRAPEPTFEPGAMRRLLEPSPIAPGVEKGHPATSPLTYGQEHDLLAESNPVTMFFGSEAADIGLVEAAIKQAAEDPSDRRGIMVDARTWTSMEDFTSALRGFREGGGRHLWVVSGRSGWDGDWVSEALKARPVREGAIRVAFVGGSGHAIRWVTDLRMSPPPGGIRVVPLQTWSLSAVEDFRMRLEADTAKVRDLLLTELGGFNRPIRRAVRELGTRPTLARFARSVEQIRGDKALIGDLGLGGPLGEHISRMGEWIEGGEVALIYLRDGLLTEGDLSTRAETARALLAYGTLMGMFDPGATPPNHDDDYRLYAVNPLVVHLLKPMEQAA